MPNQSCINIFARTAPVFPAQLSTVMLLSKMYENRLSSNLLWSASQVNRYEQKASTNNAEKNTSKNANNNFVRSSRKNCTTDFADCTNLLFISGLISLPDLSFFVVFFAFFFVIYFSIYFSTLFCNLQSYINFLSRYSRIVFSDTFSYSFGTTNFS